MEINNLLNKYKGKKVLITGHTGFKGSWLTIWLNKLGADIVGVSLNPVNAKDNFSLSKIGNKITDIRADIRNFEELNKIFQKEKPEIVFHLAAQSLVLESYENPLETIQTNTIGTAHVLEAIRLSDSVKVGVMVTTDKVYDNKEWIWPYREDEKLGGYDPYSASKGACEIIISSYRNSFFSSKDLNNNFKSIASVRAGNVIGGGDWAENRIVPDCIRSIENKESLEMRNPYAIRPWQHVLEPLGGYLLLGAKMLLEPKKFNEAWNFGPESSNVIHVGSLVQKVFKFYGKGEWKSLADPLAKHEAKYLSLDINKVKYHLNWKPVLSIEETIDFTVKWYKKYNTEDVLHLCQNQIEDYANLWISRNEN